MPAPMRVSFLGMGRMGRAMAAHVLDAGHDLTIWNRTPGKAPDLVRRGAREAGTAAEAAAEAEIAVLMLSGPDAVGDVLFGERGVVAGAPAGLLVVDSSTIGPTAARDNAARLAEVGLRYVDAPVAGTVKPATEGTLSVFAGGAPDDVERALPLLRLWGADEQVRRIGEVGAASALKLVVNTSLGAVIEGIGEALRLAGDLGVEREVALDALASGAFGWLLGQKRAMIESRDYSPASFSLELLAKDLDLAVSSAQHELPGTAATLRVARQAQRAGHGGEDFSALAGWLADGR